MACTASRMPTSSSTTRITLFWALIAVMFSLLAVFTPLLSREEKRRRWTPCPQRCSPICFPHAAARFRGRCINPYPNQGRYCPLYFPHGRNAQRFSPDAHEQCLCHNLAPPLSLHAPVKKDGQECFPAQANSGWHWPADW